MTGKEAKEKLETRYKKQNEYIKNTYDRISVTLPKGTKEWIKQNTDKTVNQFINDLVLEYKQKKEQLSEDDIDYPFS